MEYAYWRTLIALSQRKSEAFQSALTNERALLRVSGLAASASLDSCASTLYNKARQGKRCRVWISRILNSLKRGGQLRGGELDHAIAARSRIGKDKVRIGFKLFGQLGRRRT